jgi:pimeloyl-ACP methyl ester carboxylesterase
MPHVDGVEHRQVELGGLGVHVAESGVGEPLLLVHGWPQHWFQWRRLIPELAGRYRVICPDLRGFGWSDAPPGRYEKKTLARDLVRLLDVLGLQRVRLVGHDWGGFVGLLACLEAPERFDRVGALSIVSPWFRPAIASLPAGLAYQLPIVAPILGKRVTALSAFTRFVLQRGSHGGFRDEEIAIYSDQFREPERARASVALYRSFQFLELGPMALGRYVDGRLTVPTLALYGGDDLVVSDRAFARAHEHADSLRVERIPGAAHFLPEEAPEALLSHLLPFLEPRAQSPAP